LIVVAVRHKGYTQTVPETINATGASPVKQPTK